MKKALITGVTGQDGSYLAELLLKKNYKVLGMMRRSSIFNTMRIDHLYKSHPKNFDTEYGDLMDESSIHRIVNDFRPNEIYNLGAMSHVGVSFKTPKSTLTYNTLSTFNILETIKIIDKKIKFYQASSSEMFGATPPPQNEKSHFLPQSPYGISKVAAFHTTRLYRNSHNLFAANGILFNHESPRRGLNFVTRKVTSNIPKILKKEITEISFGNIDTRRDWGFSGDYVDGMWRMLQHDKPDDFVLATSKSITVKEFAELAFENQGLNYEDYVTTSQRYFRPNEVDYLLGDYSKAKSELDWEPKTNIKQLVEMMVEEDLLLAKREKVLISEGLLKPTWEHSL